MEERNEFEAFIKVAAWLVVSMIYARFTSSTIQPGKLRLLALLPVIIILLPSLPWYFSSTSLRGASAFFFVWLATFKLLLLSFGLGPLSPSLPLPVFIAVASLPVKTRSSKSNSSAPLLLPSAIKLILLAILFLLHEHHPHHHYTSLLLFGLFVYLSLDLLLASAAFLTGILLGLEVEPMFNAPLKADSLQDFWGRRWNLTVTAILRPSVYRPVRERWGQAAGVIATFAVSAFMHEVIFYYYTLARPTGELFAFFLLHGICTAVEGKAMKSGWWRPNHVAAVASTLGFVMVTGLWLFIPPMLRTGADVETLDECIAVVRSVGDGGRALISRIASVANL